MSNFEDLESKVAALQAKMDDLSHSYPVLTPEKLGDILRRSLRDENNELWRQKVLTLLYILVVLMIVMIGSLWLLAE